MSNNTNNAYLAMRIQSIILEEYKNEVNGKPKATLKFFVRDKVVQKAFPKDVFTFTGEDMVLERARDGMTPATKKVFFKLIERVLHNYKKIDYAHIAISYELNAERSIEDMRIEIEEEKHYKYS
ncbi:hypothetical protein ACFPOG_20640 [Paenibacillus aestuarii]|uniref:DUF2294 family protein n=1 Tax=Paenibacillus aestuarii TaxID=516965 RepID=A0ABW0KBJ5_9BACL